MLTNSDLNFLSKFGISENQVYEQIDLLNKNNSYVEVLEPATSLNGIRTFNSEEIDHYCKIFEREIEKLSICKFVPASGAATRMFKRLISYHKSHSEKDYNDGDFYSVKTTIENIDKFAFYDSLQKHLKEKNNPETIVEKILYSGLSYSGIPKGLIEFHKYGTKTRTAFAEQIYESIALLNNKKIEEIHFTISPEFEQDFINEKNFVLDQLQKNLNINFSFQERNTDTIAIYNNGDIVRDETGNILLRPGGHGALLQNLNRLNYDIIFIKNIDNLIHGDYLESIIKYKKLLGGILIEISYKLKDFYNQLINETSSEAYYEILDYLKNNFGADFTSSKDIKSDLLSYINRPVRVCGMVKNTGEPGGGPFWIKRGTGKSLQIIEKAQINEKNSQQKECLLNSTHFNPVDIVCNIKAPSGEKLDLNNFVDKNSCFISQKSYNGNDIRVLELPGLWNGAMADWLTIFVEIPLITFNPVKEINDLLRKEHQPKE